jgi:two-component system nitrate/nitrite sensor histidine kinase NarX
LSDLLSSTIAKPPAAASAAAPARTAPGATDILVELTAGLAAGDDLRQLLDRFLRPIVQVAGAQAGAVRIVDAHEHRMLLVGELGLPGDVRDAERSVEHDCGACGVARAGDQLAWSDSATRCALRSEVRLAASGMQRVLAVPLSHRGRVLGLFNLFFEAGREPPTDVLALLKAIGDLLGLALDNARLEREHLRATVLAERQAMAADMHDSIGQSLAFAKMRLPLLQDAIRACDLGHAERYFDDVRAAIGQAHASLRGILTQARTPMDPLGLAHALQGCVETFRRGAGVRLDFVNEAGGLQLNPDQEAQVFHVVQEALTNIARHAGAHQAWLRIQPRPGARLQIVIEDDGAGVASAAAELAVPEGTHYGLAIMRERAQRLGGVLQVGARAGGGTRVQLEFPLRAATQEAH